MDQRILERLLSTARHRVGDAVYVNGTEPGTVVARYYRPRTRSVVYDVRNARYGVVVRVPEERITALPSNRMGAMADNGGGA